MNGPIQAGLDFWKFTFVQFLEQGLQPSSTDAGMPKTVAVTETNHERTGKVDVLNTKAACTPCTLSDLFSVAAFCH